MAVRTPHFAFLNLCFNRWDRCWNHDQSANRIALDSSHVVEFKHYWIADSTVNAFATQENIYDERSIKCSLGDRACPQTVYELARPLAVVVNVIVVLALSAI